MRDWWGRSGLTVGLTALAAAFASGVFVVGVLAGGAQGRDRLLLFAVGVALTVAGVVLAALERARSERALRTAEQIAVEAEEGLTLALNGALGPLTSYLGEVAATRDHTRRQALVGQIGQAVVDAAVRLTVDGARSAFYAADPGGAALTRVAYAGRSTLPRERFLAGTPDGDFVLDLVRDGVLLYVDDIQENPLVTPSAPGYATVVAVAVTAGPERLGMLTVDAPAPGDFSYVDLELVRVLANLLGAGLAAA